MIFRDLEEKRVQGPAPSPIQTSPHDEGLDGLARRRHRHPQRSDLALGSLVAVPGVLLPTDRIVDAPVDEILGPRLAVPDGHEYRARRDLLVVRKRIAVKVAGAFPEHDRLAQHLDVRAEQFPHLHSPFAELRPDDRNPDITHLVRLSRNRLSHLLPLSQRTFVAG